MNHIDLFSGIGGFALAAREVWGDEYKNVLFCDNNRFCQEVIKKNFGKDSVIYGDIRDVTADAICKRPQEQGTELKTSGDRQLSENAPNSEGKRCGEAGQGIGRPEERATRIDLLTGGFPCQPFSHAGKRRGKEDDRYLWPEMLRVIKEFKPRWVVGENVAGIVNMALDQVCLDLEAQGYEVQPVIIPACAVNAPHRRDRVWIVALHTASHRFREGSTIADEKGHAEGSGSTRKLEGRLEGSHRDASDASESGLSGIIQGQFASLSKKTEALSGGEPRREISTSEQWEKGWLEVATRFCGVDARFPDWMDRYLREVIYDAAYEPQEMQVLFRAIQSPKIREAVGGLYKVDETEILLETVRQLQKRIGESERICLEGKATPKNKMRVMPEYEWIRCSSQRRRHSEQLAKKLTDIVQGLP